MSPSARLLQKNSVSSQAGSQLAERVVHVVSTRVRKPCGCRGHFAQIEKLLPSFLRKIAEK